MKYTFFHNTPPWYRFLFSVFVVFTLMLISSFLTVLMGIAFFDISLKEFSELSSQNIQADHINFFKYIQAVQSAGTFLLPALILAWMFSGNISGYLYLNNSVSFYSLIFIVISVVAAIPVINFTGFINSRIPVPGFLDEFIQQMEASYIRLLSSFLETDSVKEYLVNMVVIAVLPAICEEFLFRGIFQRIISDLTGNKHFGILITAAIFSIIHFHFSGLLPRFLLGVYFGYLLLWSRTLWLPIVAHFVNNAFAVTFYHVSGASPGNSAVDNIGNNLSNPLPLIISVVFFSLLVFSIYQTERIRQLKT